MRKYNVSFYINLINHENVIFSNKRYLEAAIYMINALIKYNKYKE